MRRNGMKEKFVSVIVPIYNVESYLKECIESILAQTWKNYEVILVDDGSTDLSGKLCDAYVNENDNVRVIHKENGGLSSARNAGIEVSVGNYVAFVDSDDIIHPDYLKVLVEIAESQEADLVACDFIKGENCQWIQDPAPQIEIRLGENILRKMNDKDVIVTVAWNKLYQRKFFDKYGLRYPEGKIHEDMFLTPQVLYHANKMVITNQKLYFYRQRENSIMNTAFSLKQLDGLEAILFRIKLFEKWNETQLQQKEYEGLIRKGRYLYKKIKTADENLYPDICKKIRDEMKSILRNPTAFHGLSLEYKLKLFYFLLFEK